MFKPSHFLGNIKLTDAKLLLACLSIGFFIRLMPELLAGSVPIGFDTIYYAYVMKGGVVWTHWSAFFTSTWLFNALTIPLYNLTQAEPFLLLKVVAPLLYGLNVAGICWFARKTLGWSLRMSLLASVFFALQLASLRISWDLLRNTLGLGILLFAFSYVKDVGSKRGFALFTGLSLLSVFAHEYAAVTLLVVVFGLVAWKSLKLMFNQNCKRLLFGILPALSVFSLGLYLQLNPIRYVVQSNVIGAGDSVSGKVGGLFFLVNYLKIQSSVDSYTSYAGLALNVTLLFAVLFLPYLVLVAKGYFRNGVLNWWTGLLLVGAFSCLVIPFYALEYWHRWMFMLAYPFTFFAVSGFARMYGKIRSGEASRWFSGRKSLVMVLLTFGLGVALLATPITMVYASTSVPTITGTYLYFSTNPTVPYEDVEEVAAAMKWLDNNMDVSSCAVLQHAFLEWGRLYLDESHSIVHFTSNVDVAVNTAFSQGFDEAFLVWWNDPIGWYGVTVPKYFESVQDFGHISVYAYGGISIGGS
jgi:hypothetical protein